jgi:hypothetical protein
VLSNVFIVKKVVTIVPSVKETEHLFHPVFVVKDISNLMMKTVPNVTTDVNYVYLPPKIVLFVLKTELMNQLVTVLTELMKLMNLLVHHVIMIYVILVLIIQITVSLVPVT